MKRVSSGFTLAFSLFFGVIGIPCCIFAGFLAKDSTNLVQHGIRSQGTVIEMVRVIGRKGSTYKPVVRFTTPEGENVTVQSFSSSNPPRYEPGDGVTIIYPPGHPEKANIDSFLDLWMPTILVSLIGVGFFIIAIVTTIRFIKKRQLQDWLKQHGRRIITEYTGVDINRRIRVNGHNPFQIRSRWKDPATNTEYTFESEDFWDNPTDALQNTKTIEVLIDPVDPTRYSMDTSFLG